MFDSSGSQQVQDPIGAGVVFTGPVDQGPGDRVSAAAAGTVQLPAMPPPGWAKRSHSLSKMQRRPLGNTGSGMMGPTACRLYGSSLFGGIFSNCYIHIHTAGPPAAIPLKYPCSGTEWPPPDGRGRSPTRRPGRQWCGPPAKSGHGTGP